MGERIQRSVNQSTGEKMRQKAGKGMAAVLLAAGACLFAGCAGSQSSIPESIKVETTEQNVISVASREQVKVVPDMAEITYSVYSQASDAETCQTQNNTDLTKVIELLKNEGVEERSIQTSNYGMNPIYDWNSGKSIVGYEMTTRVTVSDIPMEQVGELLSNSVDAGINSIDSVSYFSSQYDEAYEEALAKAVTAAREKAEVMAEAGGCKVGKIVTIQEYSDNQQVRYNGYAAKNSMAYAEAAAADMAVMAGEVEVEADITVEFSLE